MIKRPLPTLAICAVALLASACASGEKQVSDAAPLTPKQLATVEKQLGDKVPGEPQKCLQSFTTYDTIRVSDSMLIYRSSGKLAYRNDLRGSCPGLARDNDIMVMRQFGASTCAGDFFHLVDRSSGIRGATCVLGDFVPYRKEKES